MQSVRQVLMQQAAIPPLLRTGLIEPPEKSTSSPCGRVINLTAHAGALPAADSAGTAQSLLALPARAAARSLLALPARAAAWGATHAARAAVVAAGGEISPTAFLACSAADCLPVLPTQHACCWQRRCTQC